MSLTLRPPLTIAHAVKVSYVAIVVASLVITPFASLKVSASSPSALACHEALLGERSKEPPAIAMSPHWGEEPLSFAINYTNGSAGERTISLPTALARIKKDYKDLRIVALAGNSGPMYRLTRHNAAFLFFDWLRSNHPFVTKTVEESGKVFPTHTEVVYDDGTSRRWVEDFVTEAPYFRTTSGEIFFAPSAWGRPTLVVRALGDYNEMGDFVAPIAQYLAVPPSRILLVRDDLDLPLGQVGLGPLPAGNFSGNNSESSMARALAYQYITQAFDALANELAQLSLAAPELYTLRSLAVSLANIRYKNHLGSPTDYHKAIKTYVALREPLMSPLKKALEAAMVERWAHDEVHRQNVADQTALRLELRKEKTRIFAEKIGKSSPLSIELDARLKDLFAQQTAIEKPLRDASAAMIDRFAKNLAEPYAYSRLLIGTADESLPAVAQKELVLAPIPEDHFSPELWGQAQTALQNFLAGSN